jgi:predicted nucleotidyltransferase component of viral defense system
MIDLTALKGYARKYQIDVFTVLREYLQIVLLNAMFKIDIGNLLVFKGGTAMRLMYGSPRFSEDLDFNAMTGKDVLRKLIKEVVYEAKKSVPGLSLKELKSVGGFNAKVYLKTEIAPMPLTVKFDFSEREKTRQKIEKTISTELPIQSYSLIVAMSEQEILAEKIRTIFQRKKGRDMYDIWYLLNKKVMLDTRLLKTKFKLINKSYNQEETIRQVLSFTEEKLEKDLVKFLPLDQREMVKKLPEMIVDKITNN